jgi:hypothetical protein
VTTNDEGPEGSARSQLVAQAGELSEQGYGVRYIAQVIGRSPATAARYAREAREAAEWISLLDRAEERARKVVRLEIYAEWLMREREALSGSALDYVPVLLQVERERARVTGSDATTRMSVTDDRHPPQVDPATVAAVRDAQRRADDETRALRAGADDT